MNPAQHIEMLQHCARIPKCSGERSAETTLVGQSNVLTGKHSMHPVDPGTAQFTTIGVCTCTHVAYKCTRSPNKCQQRERKHERRARRSTHLSNAGLAVQANVAPEARHGDILRDGGTCQCPNPLFTTTIDEQGHPKLFFIIPLNPGKRLAPPASIAAGTTCR